MRPLLFALCLTGCDVAPTAVIRRSAAICAVPVDCVMVADTATVWIGGQKYLEIVEQCA